MAMLRSFVIFTLLACSYQLQAQSQRERDSLFGSITNERAWWDLMHYDLQVEVFPERQAIEGYNQVTFKVLKEGDRMQIDLQQPMEILSVKHHGKTLDFNRMGMFYYIQFEQPLVAGQTDSIKIAFSGKPRIAKNPPWDGGFTWAKDSNGKEFIATSNQGIGSSIWWPNKDHPYDEPDKRVDLKITVPKGLTAVGNGRLIRKWDQGDKMTFHWRVVNPINNYGVNINVGDYVRMGHHYEGESGLLQMDYWVLGENQEKAREQFKQAPMMMEAFEYWFGPYPFYEDSFKLVEVPYLGMEHQSSVTYGNGYQNGYLGRDLSGSGWGLKFDFIIIHEAGHEWFANNITNDDVADMWIHEGFTAYSENLYLDYHFGKKAASEYVTGTRVAIRNDRPLIGSRGFRKPGSGDMYYKGANILHTLRQLIEDDSLWREILRDLNKRFRHSTINSKELEFYINKKSGKDLTAFWEQYLRTTMVPLIEYRIDGNELAFRYRDIVDGFDMPLIALINGREKWIFPKADWKVVEWDKDIRDFDIKTDFYVAVRQAD
jgi:aminopeptidase N